MGIIQGVLKEELQNSARLLKRHEQALEKLPKGSLVVKKIRGGKFYYLASREGSKVRFVYKGKLDDKEIARLKGVAAQRAKYRKLIKELKDQLKFIKRALHERK